MKYLICLLSVAVMAVFSTYSTAFAEGRVLLVHSYHQGYSWTDGITKGVKEGLKDTGVVLEVFYMDTKRNTSEDWKTQAGERAMEKTNSFKPDVVIAADDNAQEYYVSKYLKGKPAPQVVFCGVNAEASKYGYPAANVTGILERPPFVPALELLSRLYKNVKTVRLITDDSTTSTAMVSYIRTLVLPIEIASFDQPKTFSQWKGLIKAYRTTADAVFVMAYHTVKDDKTGKVVNPEEVIEWTVSNIKKPTVGVYDFAVNDGVLAGVVESENQQGRMAAEVAKKIILDGMKSGDFPIEKARGGTLMINLNTASVLGLKVPEDLMESAVLVK